MIPRILTSQHGQDILQGCLWGILAIYNGAAAMLAVISEADWNRALGPHGVAFISIVAVIVLWANGIATRKAEDKRRAEEIASANASRAELLEALKESIQSNQGLTERCIAAVEKQTAATVAMDKTIQHHTTFLTDKFEAKYLHQEEIHNHRTIGSIRRRTAKHPPSRRSNRGLENMGLASDSCRARLSLQGQQMIGDKTIAVIAAVIAVAVWFWNVYYYGS